MDGLSVVLFFSSYMRLGTRFNPLPPRWMIHHDVKAQTGFWAHWTESLCTPFQSQQLVSAELLLDPSSTMPISTPSTRTSVSTSNREPSRPIPVCFQVLINVVLVYISWSSTYILDLIRWSQYPLAYSTTDSGSLESLAPLSTTRPFHHAPSSQFQCVRVLNNHQWRSYSWPS